MIVSNAELTFASAELKNVWVVKSPQLTASCCVDLRPVPGESVLKDDVDIIVPERALAVWFSIFPIRVLILQKLLF